MFKNEAAKFVYTRTYSRWIEEKQRRETWEETVERYINFIKEERGDKIPPKVIRKAKEAILNFHVMPSMRALWAAGEAAKKDNTTMYNCSFSVVDSVTAFSEALYVLCCGTGYGFSVQNKYILKLPVVSNINPHKKNNYVVEDSKIGWANSIKELMKSLYSGIDLEFDYSKVRPKGARLKTMGGRASGPAPLITLHGFIKDVFYNAQGRKLTSIECHDIMNQIAEVVVSAGVRRSSQVSLSDLDDELMRTAKDWPFPPRRSMANNSAVYTKKPSAINFLKEWSTLASSGTGERGIFNLQTARIKSPSRRISDLILGSNPCLEILLRNKQFCNLTEVVVRSTDDLDDLIQKVETATWLGVIQSTFTYFPYLTKKWQSNCEEERLLGVSLTGQMDNNKILTDEALKLLKARSIKIAKHASEKMGINIPTAITCVKPSGTVSQVVNSASGLHPRFSEYYIRRYRIAATDPLYKMMKEQGIKFYPENGQEDLKEKDINTWVVEFPIKSPKHSTIKDNLSAIEQLEWYKKVQTNWSEHNCSCTVYVKDNEWFEVGNWVYENWDIINGVSFLPFDGGHYKLAPYEEIDKKEYDKKMKEQIKIDYSQLSKYELEDNTEGGQTFSCVGDKCEL